MDSLLIENSSWTKPDWLKLLNIASEKLPYKFLDSPNLELNKPEFIYSTGSIGGVELLLQSNGLKIFPSTFPSRKDLRFIRQLMEIAGRKKCKIVDSSSAEVKPTHYSDEKLQKLFESITDQALEKDTIIVQSGSKKADITSLIDKESTKEKLERKLIDSLDRLFNAQEPDVYPIDEMQSVIWDGSPIWVDESVKQLLFSQKVFKGRLCGQIIIDEFAQAVPNRVWNTGFGYLIEDKKHLSSSDMDAIAVRMGEHFEKKEVKKSIAKLEIEVGKLQEISYMMAKSVFTNKSISSVTEHYTKQGIGKEQLEVTAVAVSAMLEIAAINRGKSITEMGQKLKEKTKLTEHACKAVVTGFVQAATEVDPKQKKKYNYWLISLIGIGSGFLIWYFFLK